MAAGSRTGGLYFSIRLRFAADAGGALDELTLEPAVARALGRAFARARDSLPAEVAVGDGVVLHSPYLAKGTLSPDREAAVLKRIARAIEAAARAGSLPVLSPAGGPARRRTPTAAPRAGPDGLPTSVAEEFDPKRFDPGTNTYTIPSYGGGKESIALAEQEKRFEPLINVLRTYYAALESLKKGASALRPPNQLRKEALKSVQNEIDTINAAIVVIAALSTATATERKDLPIAVKDLEEEFILKNRPFPAPERISERVEYVKKQVFMANLVRARVATFNARAAKPTDPSDGPLRDVLMDVGTFYIYCVTGGDATEAPGRFSFLESFYSVPGLIDAYAAVRLARIHLTGDHPPGLDSLRLWDNLVRAIGQSPQDKKYGTLEETRPESTDASYLQSAINLDKERWRKTAQNYAVNNALAIRDLVAQNDQMPFSLSDVGETPTAAMAADLSARVLHLQVQIAVIALWWPVDSLSEILLQEIYLGDYMPYGRSHKELVKETITLRGLFDNEVNRFPHPKNIKELLDDWEARVKSLSDEITSALKKLRITRFIVEQIPLLFVGGGFASGIGTWVGRATEGSRLLVILAEGAALTAFNVAITLTSPQPLTAGGIAGQFVVNVVLAGFGQIIRSISIKLVGDSAEQIASTRALLVKVGVVGGAVPSAAAIQTTAQAIEARVQGQGGETDLTTMLTLNALLTGLGMAFGLALGETKTPEGTSLVRLSPTEIKTYVKLNFGVEIDASAVTEWAALEHRTAEFSASLVAIQQASQQRTLTEPQFNDWKAKSKALADDLERKLPGLAQFLGKDVTAAEIQNGIARMRALLDAAKWESAGGPVLALPEYVPGVQRTGARDALVFDPADARTKGLLPALKRTYPEAEFLVEELPGGGYQVTRKVTGEVVLLALPAGSSAARILPSIESISSGTKTSAGLSVVRRQTVVPQLEALLTQAMGASKESTVPFLLQTIGEIVDVTDASQLRGLANFLSKGGNPDVLATALRLRSSADIKINRRAVVGDLLQQMAAWSPEEVLGLAAMYESISRISADRFTNFLYSRSPFEIKTALGYFNTLAKRPPGSLKGLNTVIGLLTSSSPEKVQGAYGVLRAAVKFTESNPSFPLEFEAVEAMAGQELRLVDIRVRAELPAGAGKTGTVQIVVKDVEVKEITANRLSSHSPEELAKDILNDWNRQTVWASPSEVKPFLTIQWLVRRTELMQSALERLHRRGIPIPSEGAQWDMGVEIEMKAILKPQLEDAFTSKVLDPMRATDEGRAALDKYRKEFDDRARFLGFF